MLTPHEQLVKTFLNIGEWVHVLWRIYGTLWTTRNSRWITGGPCGTVENHCFKLILHSSS